MVEAEPPRIEPSRLGQWVRANLFRTPSTASSRCVFGLFLALGRLPGRCGSSPSPPTGRSCAATCGCSWSGATRPASCGGRGPSLLLAVAALGLRRRRRREAGARSRPVDEPPRPRAARARPPPLAGRAARRRRAVAHPDARAAAARGADARRWRRARSLAGQARAAVAGAALVARRARRCSSRPSWCRRPGEIGWEDWGGLHLAVFVTVVGIGAAFPLGVLVALARQSSLPALRGWRPATSSCSGACRS